MTPAKKNSTDFGKPVNQLKVPKCHYIFVGQKTSRITFLSHEVIGYASLNSDDGSDGLTGTNLVTKDGEMKYPVT